MMVERSVVASSQAMERKTKCKGSQENMIKIFYILADKNILYFACGDAYLAVSIFQSCTLKLANFNVKLCINEDYLLKRLEVNI